MPVGIFRDILDCPRARVLMTKLNKKTPKVGVLSLD